MGQRSIYAVVKDAQIGPLKEECASSMVQRKSDVAKKGAQIGLEGVECAAGMGQRSRSEDAGLKDAQNTLRKEEYA